VRISGFGSGVDSQAAAAAAAASTVMITFQLAGKATRDALFLSTFGVASLPAMVVTAALVSAVLSIGLAHAMAKSRPSWLVPRLFGLSSALLIAEWGLALQARRPAAILVYLHFTALGALLVSGFWAIVNERFDPSTARRTIARITAGGSLGGLLGGLLPERVGAYLPLTAMLPILAGLHLLAAALVVGVEHGASHPSEDRATAEGVPAFAPRQILRASSYLRGLALLVALTSAAEGLLDYVFKARAAAATSSGEELLRFFAAFYTATALLGILIQVTALRGALGRLGIARSAALLPAGVSAGAIGAFLVPGLTPIVIARGVEVILRSSLFRAAYELLFTPVEPREKRATKLLVDVGAARVGDAAGGAVIQTTLMMVGSGAGRVLLAAAVALSAGALVVARRLHQGYVGALEGSLHRRAGDLPDVVQDDAAALLQTIGGFDLSGIRTRTTLFAGTPWMAPPTTSSISTPVNESPLRRAIHTGKAEEVRAALGQGPLAANQIDSAIELLAWDQVAPDAIKALRVVAAEHVRLLVQHLLDQDEDFAIRRRLVNVLIETHTVEAFQGLMEALSDRRFEVRYRAGRALAHMAPDIPGLEVNRQRVYDVVLREMAVERGVWESRQLIDTADDQASPMEVEVLRDRASRSLEHLFTLLSLVLPAQTLRLSFHALHTGDKYLRGTALEYLETVLPEAVRAKLWPILRENESQPARPSGESVKALEELLASRESILVALAQVRRVSGVQPGSPTSTPEG
jgi:ATP:ADP antiporter, AAA family